MSATAARTKPKTTAVPKGKPLPPARAFARTAHAAGPKVVNVGGKQARAGRERFALPKSFRRSAAQLPSAALPFANAATPRENSIVSGAGLLEALVNLPQTGPARREVALDLHPWSFSAAPDALNDRELSSDARPRVNAVIQFAQLPTDQFLIPPALPLHRPLGKPIGSNSLKRIDSTSITSTGAQLPVAVKNSLSRTFSVDLTPIRVHTDASAQGLAKSLSTRAFAYGNHIFLGPGEQPTDLRLMAHEVAHAIQQSHGVTLQHFTPAGGGALEGEAQAASAAATRGESFTVQQRAGARPQGYGLGDLASDLGIPIPDPLDWLANKANVIPGFRMFTIVLGVNPINMSAVDRSAANILRALIEFLPGGGLITQALDNSGVFEKAGAFVEQQISSLGMTGDAIKAAVTAFIDRLSLKRIVTEPGTVWEEAKAIFTGPIDRIISFATGLVGGIIDLIKEAILKPIAKLAEGTEGYNLLKGILGKDPITGETVDRSAETLLGPLLKMIGLGDVWQKMQDAKAIPRAWAWFQSTMSQLVGFVSQIPDLFIAAFKSLTIEDIILVPLAFSKLASVFGGFMGKFVSWGVDAMFKLLEIVFDVVSPGAWGYIQKTGAALKSILQNPLPFVGNLVNAAKLGFQNFGANFLTHLKKGLIDWLVGSLEGIYIPTALTLLEFGKMAISILGVTWAQIRGKIVKALGPSGEMIMSGLETVFDVVMALINGGPKAAWEVIQDKLTGLKDTIVQGIIDFVKEAVVTKAIPKLIAMFIPGAGFISAIISIYDTVMVFVEKIAKIIEVVNAFINSIVQIASGNIGAAAAKVESILGGLLSLAISFLAGLVGLGKVSSKIREVVKKVRATVDKAIEAAVTWIVNKAKSMFKSLFASKRKDGDPEKQNLVNAGLAAIDAGDKAVMKDGKLKKEDAEKVAVSVKKAHPVFKYVTVVETKTSINYKYAASPEGTKPGGQKETVGSLGIDRKMIKWEEATHKEFAKSQLWAQLGKQPGEYKDAKLDIRHKVSISDTIKNTDKALSPKTIDEAAEMLAGKGCPCGEKTKAGIVAAAKVFLTKANNDLSNLTLGPLGSNRAAGKEYDPGEGATATDPAHKAQRSDYAETYGFKDEEFTITIKRQSVRRGQALETETVKSGGSRDKPK
jgi:hypothetical protein